MKKYLYLIKNSKIPTYLKYWLMYSSKKISLLIQSLPITLENTIKDLKIVINKIYGNSEQNTTTGKNLLPPLDSGSLNGLTFTTNSNGITTISGTTTNVTNYFKNVNKILPAGTYTLSINLSYTPPASSSQLILQDINNVRLATINLWKITSRTFTLSADTEIKNYYLFSNSGIQHNGTISIQLEEGSTATSYEPYTGGIPSPNPSYPQEITNVTGDVEVKVQNKNLFDKNNMQNGFIPLSGDYPTSNPSYPNARYYLVPVKANDSVAISGSTNNFGRVRCIDNVSNQVIGTISTSENDYYTSNNNYSSGFVNAVITAKKDIILAFMVIQGTDTLDTFQVEYGLTASTYVAHKEQKFTFPLGNEKLMLGDYLADDGIHHVRGQYAFTGSETWNFYSSSAAKFGIILPNVKNEGQSINPSFLCTQYRSLSWDALGNNSPNNLISITSANMIRFRNTSIDTLENWTQYITEQYNNGTPITVEYPLNEEVIVPYTSAQQEAYNQIKQALSYEGQTNISSNQNIYLDIDYIKRG